MNQKPEKTTPLLDIFLKAYQAGYKRPKLRTQLFILSLAPFKGNNPYCIYLKSNVKGEHEAYLGKIKPDGLIPCKRICKGVSFEDYELQAIENALYYPETEAIRYGHQTGQCSICGRLLTNKLSIQYGIGPICREKYGWILPPPEPEQLELPDLNSIDLENL